MGALIGPTHGEAGAGSADVTGRDGVTGEKYASDRETLESLVADLAELRTVLNKVRADLVDARTVLTNTVTKHNALDTTVNAGAQQVTPTVAAATATADAAALGTRLATKP